MNIFALRMKKEKWAYAFIWQVWNLFLSSRFLLTHKNSKDLGRYFSNCWGASGALDAHRVFELRQRNSPDEAAGIHLSRLSVESLRREGRVASIGLSALNVTTLKIAADRSELYPAVQCVGQNLSAGRILEPREGGRLHAEATEECGWAVKVRDCAAFDLRTAHARRDDILHCASPLSPIDATGFG